MSKYSIQWRPKVLLQLACLLLLLNFTTAQQSSEEVHARAAKAHHQQHQSKPKANKPNIVIIMVDDMGFNDVSFHGSDQIHTPNIDALAFNGITLKNLYVPNLCTPSRATLLTGRYPSHTGTQHWAIVNDEPWGLPLDQRNLLPELLRNEGYSTSLVGKWHLGFYKKEMTPTFRGFDHHYGYYSGFIDYNDHTMRYPERNYTGVDFRCNLERLPEANGTYATDLFTREAERIISEHDAERPLFMLMSHLAVHTGNDNDPMQAPQEEIDKFMHISDPKRRVYAGMLASLDKSVGSTIHALDKKGILKNTIILLYSDNGAPTVGIYSNAGSNHPFRGQKQSPWEGGIRSAGAIWSPLLNNKRYVSEQVMHAVDLLPTLATAAGIRLPTDLKLDGVDLWDALSNKRKPKSRQILHVLDDIDGISSYMRGNMKYVNGTLFDGIYDTWLGDIPSVTEADPLSAYYVQRVLSSEVHQVLGDKRLNNAQVQQLRREATVSCPENSEDYNQDIYRCDPSKAACLFDIVKDPCERYNLAQKQPKIVRLMEQDIDKYRLSAIPPARVPRGDPLSNPARFDGYWQWWYGTGSNSGTNCASYNNLVSALWCSILLLMVSVTF